MPLKIAGYVLTVLGGLMVLGSLNTAISTYNLNSQHDLGKLLGGLGISALMIVGGLSLVKKGR